LLDATAKVAEKMPAKGSAKVRKGDRCSKTGMKLLVQWAYDLGRKEAQARAHTVEELRKQLPFSDTSEEDGEEEPAGLDC